MTPTLAAYRQRAALFAALIGWCGGLLAIRAVQSGSPQYRFLVWNLFLAAVPAAVAPFYLAATVRGSPAVVRAGAAVVWLVFLPNAPYLLTDLIHLTDRPPVPKWYDLAILLSFAGTGLLLGYSSLIDVQAGVTWRHGRVVGWAVVAAALVLSGFGIYLGRFLRWNSWDVLTRPHTLAVEISDRLTHPLSHPRTLAVTAVYGGGLTLGYIALRVLGNASPSPAAVVTATPEPPSVSAR